MLTLNFLSSLMATGWMWTLQSAAPISQSPITEFELSTPANHVQMIVASPDGTVWATACAKPKIIRLGKDGKTAEFPVPGAKAKLLQGITVGADGNIWFTSLSDNTIRRMSPQGKFTGEFKIPTVAPIAGDPEAFTSRPRGIAAGPDGSIWFAEQGGNKIGRIAPNGEISEIAVPTAQANPYQPAFDKSGNIWFCESVANQVGRLDPKTGKVVEFPLPTKGSFSREIVCGSDGNMWFTENRPDQVGRITPLGEVKEFPLAVGSNAVGIAAGADGNLWVSLMRKGQIARVTTEGQITTFDIPSGPKAEPFGLCAGPEGTIWFAEQMQCNRIGRLNLRAIGK